MYCTLIEKQITKLKRTTQLKQLRFALTALCSNYRKNAQNKNLKQKCASGLITHRA